MQWLQKALIHNYVNFKGRASRTEFWVFFIFAPTVVFAAANVGLLISDVFAFVLAYIVMFGLAIPYYSIRVRRLHDIGQSGWWLVAGTTFVLIIPLYYFYLFHGSDPGDNEYGPSPKGIK